MLETKRVFISGPMTGYEDFNRPAFMEAEEKLKKAGFSVFNPAWMDFDSGFSNDAIMSIDLVALSHCNYIYQLPGWKYSKGASAEYMFALASDIQFVNVDWLEWYLGQVELINIVNNTISDETFDKAFEENKKVWAKAAEQMHQERMQKLEEEINSLKEVKLDVEKVEKGEYQSARPSD